MHISVSLSKLFTIHQPVKVEQSDPFGEPFLRRIKGIRKISLSNSFWSDKAPYRLAEEKGRSGVENQAEEQWLKIDRTISLANKLYQVVDSFPKNMNALILTML
jgi:hypothetical protein